MKNLLIVVFVLFASLNAKAQIKYSLVLGATNRQSPNDLLRVEINDLPGYNAGFEFMSTKRSKLYFGGEVGYQLDGITHYGSQFAKAGTGNIWHSYAYFGPKITWNPFVENEGKLNKLSFDLFASMYLLVNTSNQEFASNRFFSGEVDSYFNAIRPSISYKIHEVDISIYYQFQSWVIKDTINDIGGSTSQFGGNNVGLSVYIPLN